MQIFYTMNGKRRKAAHNTPAANILSSIEAYAIRTLARRAGISLLHAKVAAELAGILKERADG